MLKSRFIHLMVLSCFLFVDAIVASPAGGLERRRHRGHHQKNHHHHHHHHRRLASVANTTLPTDIAVSSPNSISSQADCSAIKSPPSTDNGLTSASNLRIAPYTPPPGGFPLAVSKSGGIQVKDVCFGFSSVSINKGLGEMNRLRQKYTTEVDQIPRPGVYWNSDLAFEAYKTASACKWQHGDTPGLGQNLNGAGPERNLTAGVVLWWGEEDAFKKQGPDGPDGGHIGAALWNQVTAMGCGIADCTQTSPGFWITACNMNNFANNKTYPAQSTPNCPVGGVVVPYQRAGI